MEKVLIIVRGLPGSGKSAFAKLLGRAVCCADDYFTRKGKYTWSSLTIGTAHYWCRRKCSRFMQAGISPVIVANTSTIEKEFQSYIDMANIFGYKVFSIVVENRHNGMNSHNVPEEALEKMRKRFEIKL
jgi:predicted kinase